eukprot:5650288-Heterocapsa_arctica.AAC.1
MTLRRESFHSNQCSSRPSNFSGRARPLRSIMDAAVTPGSGGIAESEAGTGVGSAIAAIIRSSPT